MNKLGAERHHKFQHMFIEGVECCSMTRQIVSRKVRLESLTVLRNVGVHSLGREVFHGEHVERETLSVTAPCPLCELAYQLDLPKERRSR